MVWLNGASPHFKHASDGLLDRDHPSGAQTSLSCAQEKYTQEDYSRLLKCHHVASSEFQQTESLGIIEQDELSSSDEEES